MISARFDLADKVAIVTGGTGQIGSAITARLHAEGVHVVVAGRKERQRSIEQEYRGKSDVSFQQCDVTKEQDVQALVRAVMSKYGKLDIVVNNAGTMHEFVTTPELDPWKWRRVIQVNLNSAFLLCHFAIPCLVQGGGGVIINIASVGGFGGDWGMGAYNASKAGLINYTKALAVEQGRNGIRANAICPGAIIADHNRARLEPGDMKERWLSRIPLGRYGVTEDVAKAVAFLASDEAAYISGAVLTIDGGLSAHSPQPHQAT